MTISSHTIQPVSKDLPLKLSLPSEVRQMVTGGGEGGAFSVATPCLWNALPPLRLVWHLLYLLLDTRTKHIFLPKLFIRNFILPAFKWSSSV